MNQELTLERLLQCREERVRFRAAFLSAHPGASAVCLTVNVPGPVKRTPRADLVQNAGGRALLCALRGAEIPIEAMAVQDRPSGLESYFALNAPALEVKALTCALEGELPYGRLLDADVFGPDHKAVSRKDLGLPPRGCMICGKPGPDCARSRAHGLEALLRRFDQLSACLAEKPSSPDPGNP